ncbi:hypothetical protein [Salidesulfovibrio onnuriiensis]|uniref:hypothetical protein n=1 Tax=Salidesulfovibrio onnuriiensis TaxID=2583823 RepID=UPI0011CA0ECF|nr:hypothetical protein [Salidesulfovibrio onnuriiensis]
MEKHLKAVKRLLAEQGADPSLAEKSLDTEGTIPESLLDTVSAVLDGFDAGMKQPEGKNEKK